MQSIHNTTHLDYAGEYLMFSRSPCDTCGSPLGSERHTVYDRQNAMLLEVCTDCLLYITYPKEHQRPGGF